MSFTSDLPPRQRRRCWQACHWLQPPRHRTSSPRGLRPVRTLKSESCYQPAQDFETEIGLTFVQRYDGVDDLPHGEGGLLFLRVLSLSDEPPVDDEDGHTQHLDAAAHPDVPEMQVCHRFAVKRFADDVRLTCIGT